MAERGMARRLAVARALCGPLVGALVALALSSCLVTSTADLPEPTQTPPYLNGSSALPSLSQLIVVDRSTVAPIVFTAGVRADDDGVPLEARLVADWPSADGTLAFATVAPGSFAEERTV